MRKLNLAGAPPEISALNPAHVLTAIAFPHDNNDHDIGNVLRISGVNRRVWGARAHIFPRPRANNDGNGVHRSLNVPQFVLHLYMLVIG